jgi:hypothetical protein
MVTLVYGAGYDGVLQFTHEIVQARAEMVSKLSILQSFEAISVPDNICCVEDYVGPAE